MTPYELNAGIQTREDFVKFVRALASDFRDNPQSWGNNTLALFLQAVAAWTNDMDGYYINQSKPVPADPNWKVIADMLIAGKLYE